MCVNYHFFIYTFLYSLFFLLSLCVKKHPDTNTFLVRTSQPGVCLNVSHRKMTVHSKHACNITYGNSSLSTVQHYTFTCRMSTSAKLSGVT